MGTDRSCTKSNWKLVLATPIILMITYLLTYLLLATTLNLLQMEQGQTKWRLCGLSGVKLVVK